MNKFAKQAAFALFAALIGFSFTAIAGAQDDTKTENQRSETFSHDYDCQQSGVSDCLWPFFFLPQRDESTQTQSELTQSETTRQDRQDRRDRNDDSILWNETPEITELVPAQQDYERTQDQYPRYLLPSQNDQRFREGTAGTARELRSQRNELRQSTEALALDSLFRDTTTQRETVRGEIVRGETVRGESVRGESVRGELVEREIVQQPTQRTQQRTQQQRRYLVEQQRTRGEFATHDGEGGYIQEEHTEHFAAPISPIVQQEAVRQIQVIEGQPQFEGQPQITEQRIETQVQQQQFAAPVHVGGSPVVQQEAVRQIQVIESQPQVIEQRVETQVEQQQLAAPVVNPIRVEGQQEAVRQIQVIENRPQFEGQSQFVEQRVETQVQQHVQQSVETVELDPNACVDSVESSFDQFLIEPMHTPNPFEVQKETRQEAAAVAPIRKRQSAKQNGLVQGGTRGGIARTAKRSQRRSRKAGAWWAFLPLFLLPFLCWGAWKFMTSLETSSEENTINPAIGQPSTRTLAAAKTTTRQQSQTRETVELEYADERQVSETKSIQRDNSRQLNVISEQDSCCDKHTEFTADCSTRSQSVTPVVAKTTEVTKATSKTRSENTRVENTRTESTQPLRICEESVERSETTQERSTQERSTSCESNTRSTCGSTSGSQMSRILENKTSQELKAEQAQEKTQERSTRQNKTREVTSEKTQDSPRRENKTSRQVKSERTQENSTRDNDEVRSTRDSEVRSTRGSSESQESPRRENKTLRQVKSELKQENSTRDSKVRSTRGSSFEGQRDDFTQIEGITEEAQQALYSGGFFSFSDLQKADKTQLSRLFSDNNLKFTDAQTKSWITKSGSMTSDWSINEQPLQQSQFNTDDSSTRSTRSSSESQDSPRRENKTSRQVKSERTQERSTRESNVGSTLGSSFEGQRDDFTQIEGITEEAQQALYSGGYFSFSDLKRANKKQLSRVLSDSGLKFSNAQTKSWITQSRSFVSERANDQKSRSNSDSQARGSNRVSGNASGQRDDLTKIRGIGAKASDLLQRSGINSYRDLYEAGPQRLVQLFAHAGPKFKLIDPSHWSQQAAFAMNADWNGLTQWQSENSGSSTTQIEHDYCSMDPDDLTAIRGIGPATQKVLREKGIQRFEQVANMTSDQLSELFADRQDKFNLLDPATWPQQAQSLLRNRVTDEELENGLMNEIQSIAQMAKEQPREIQRKSEYTRQS